MKQQFLKTFIQNLAPSAVSALPGAGINAALGLVTGGPLAALAYGGGDLLLNTPAIAAARVARPGSQGIFRGKDAAGKAVKREMYNPSGLETGVNVAASFASYPLVDYLSGGRFYQDRLAQQQQQYFYPGVNLPPGVLEEIRQARAEG
tara:strand:+ start:768 stop:1211 length:444 start_codon:yes stop_codon:yes gene_type:complete